MTEEKQMAAYEEEMKNTDWGHQPCYGLLIMSLLPKRDRLGGDELLHLAQHLSDFA